MHTREFCVTTVILYICLFIPFGCNVLSLVLFNANLVSNVVRFIYIYIVIAIDVVKLAFSKSG